MSIGLWAEDEKAYSDYLKRGSYYAAAGLVMDLLQALLGISSLIDPETGGRLWDDDPELLSVLAWLCRSPDGTRVERWLNMLAENPESPCVLCEVVEHARGDFRRLVERDERGGIGG